MIKKTTNFFFEYNYNSVAKLIEGNCCFEINH